MVFYDNYVKLCNKKGISPSAAAEEMGMQRSVVTAWKNGRVPRRANLQKVADYFGVEIEDLLAGKEKSASSDDDAVADFLEDLRRGEVRVLLAATRNMTKEEVEAMAYFAKRLKGEK